MVSKQKLLSLTLLAVVMGGLQACGSSPGSSANSAATAPVDPGTANIIDGLHRTCRIPVRYTDSAAHTAALEALVQAVVIRKERPTTMCVAAMGSPLTSFDASLRVEYEDDVGLRWATFRKRDLVYSTQANGKFRLIYLDNYGYVGLNTTRDSVGNYTGTIQIANIDASQSYLQEIDAFLQNIANVCSQSPAKCLNPVFIQDPTANVPPTQDQIVQRADEAFAGQHNAQAFVLGTVSFTNDFVERTLF